MALRPLCFALLLAARLLPGADAGLPDFLPTGTKVVIGVRLRAITGSPLFQGVASQAMSAGSDWMTIASMIGFDPLKDIDEILIASTADRQNAPALLVVRGRFDVARLSAGANRYRGVPLLSGGKGPDSMIALLDASTALAGDAPTVRTAIDRRGSGGRISAALAQQVEALRGRYDIWGAGQVQPGAVPAAGQASGFDSVDRFEFGLLVTHGIEVSAELHARSPKDLEKLAASLQFFRMAIAAQPQQSSADIKWETHVEGDTLKLSLAVPENVLQRAALARSASAKPSLSGASLSITGPSLPAATAGAPATALPPASDANGDTVVLRLPGRR
jgi:hypothetical protein